MTTEKKPPKRGRPKKTNAKAQVPRKRTASQDKAILFRTSAHNRKKIALLCELRGQTMRELFESLIQEKWQMARPYITDWIP